MKNNGAVIALIIIFAIVMAVVSPLLFIWSLNTLFGLKIAFGFWEWLAALLLLGTFTGTKLKINQS